jgi:hypothetical protein
MIPRPLGRERLHFKNSEIATETRSKLKPVVSEDRPLNPPILGDFELEKVTNSSRSWLAGGLKTSVIKR